MQSIKHTFSYKDTSYPYWTYGEEKNPPLLFIPGFTGVHTDVEQVAELLSKKAYVIVADLPGWGEAPIGSSQLTLESYVDFLYELTQEYAQLFIAGHCLGSIIAFEFACKYSKKVTSLFVISVPYPKGDIGEEFILHLTQLSTHFPKRLKPLLYFWRSRFFAIPTGFFVIQIKSLREKAKIILHNAIKQQFQNEETVEKNWESIALYNYEKLKNLAIPVTIIHGGKDLLIRPLQEEKLSCLIPHAKVIIIPNAGHMPPVETPEELARIIINAS